MSNTPRCPQNRCPQSRRPRNRATAALRSIACLAIAGSALHAQSFASAASRALPDAPSTTLQQAAAAPQPAVGTSSVYGTVTDIRGGLVPGAKIHVKEKDRANTREVTSDSEGKFNVSALPAGVYFVIISSPGLESLRTPDFTLKSAEVHELPDIALPIASNTTTVDVVMTQAEVADEELKLETQQRVFGVFPNFYTSFLWDAAPLNARQKFKLSFHSVSDPVVFLSTAIVAGVEQARNTYPEYGDDAEGYGKRYGAAYGDAVIGRMLGAFVFPSIFRQDPRYFYMGPNYSTGKRFKHAILAGLIARGDNGKWQPNYSHVAGNAAAGAISTTYHPDANTAGQLAYRNALIGIAGGGVQGLVREFVTSRITHKVPAYAKGKPAPTTTTATPEPQPK